ncbi:hypothetical protein J3F83DRAFT_725997, partial [Trichoderma novae-zelandiae]
MSVCCVQISCFCVPIVCVIRVFLVSACLVICRFDTLSSPACTPVLGDVCKDNSQRAFHEILRVNMNIFESEQ